MFASIRLVLMDSAVADADQVQCVVLAVPVRSLAQGQRLDWQLSYHGSHHQTTKKY